MKDFTNQKFGDYILTKYLGNQTWEARCEKCGLVRTYKTPNIKIGEEGKGICTCSTSGIRIGDRFGKLVVKYRDINKSGSGRVCWICECDCGNTLSVAGKALKNGNTRSCGCLNNEARAARIQKWNEEHAVDITGERSGLLTAVRKATEQERNGRPKGSNYWYCLCDCGNTHIVSLSDFKLGKVASCGCLNSKGEARITTILLENDILFSKQYAFDDLKSEQGRHFFFDFAIFNADGSVRYLIEFDGIQHFSKNHQFSNDQNALKTIQKRDSIKNNYAISKRIPLIRIPYTKLPTLDITDLQLETTKFLLKEGDE
jgi:hypothetical protein